MKSTILALGMALGAVAASAQPPANLKPTAVAGAGLNVTDLEAQKAWYTAKLGLAVVQTLQRDGKPYEYVLGYQGPGGAVVALLRSTARPPGPNPWGRIILVVPDEKALGTALAAQGVAGREVVPNVAWFTADPEGNAIELYTPPK